MVLPFLTIYCTQKLHFSIAQAGLIMGLYGFGSITGAFLGGKFTDRFGFYYLQIFALLSGGLLFMLLGAQTSFVGLAVVTYLLSMCNESFRPANSAAIAHYSTDETRTRSFALNRLAINLGWFFGGSLGGLIAALNYHLLFWVDGSTNILAAILLLILISATNAHRPKQINQTAKSDHSAYHDRVYLFFIGMIVLFAICFFQIFALQPVFYKTQWHLSESFIGLTFGLSGLFIAFFEMLLVHKLEGKRHHLEFMALGMIVVGLGFMLLNILPGNALMAMVVTLVITLGEMLSMPFTSAFWVARTNQHNRGEYGALYTMAWSAAQIIAPIAGSAIIVLGGYKTLWWLVGALCFTASGGLWFLHQHIKLNNSKSYLAD